MNLLPNVISSFSDSFLEINNSLCSPGNLAEYKLQYLLQKNINVIHEGERTTDIWVFF